MTLFFLNIDDIKYIYNFKIRSHEKERHLQNSCFYFDSSSVKLPFPSTVTYCLDKVGFGMLGPEFISISNHCTGQHWCKRTQSIIYIHFYSVPCIKLEV